jgi:hypothetical protein
VAAGDAQRAVRAEVVLEVDDHERVAGGVDGEGHRESSLPRS